MVDATLGNGHDALFLARLVGPEGLVIGFDLQQAAVDASRERLEAEDITWYEFHCCGHEELSEKTGADVGAVMFNLGYLPNADKKLITTAKTTLFALEAAMLCLRVGGVITVMCYSGHEGGEHESASVVKFVSALRREDWRVFHYAMMNGANHPPFLVVLEKMRNTPSEENA